MNIIKYKKIFLIISLVLVISSLGLLFVSGLPLSIEFTGGALAEISYPEGTPEAQVLNDAVSSLDFGNVSIQPTGENGYFIKLRDLTEVERLSLFEALSINGEYVVSEESFTSIGPSLGEELKRKAIVAIVVVVIAIILFVAYAFRKVSEVGKNRSLGTKRLPSSWTYGLIAILALLHDIIITTGVFILFSHILGAEADALFVVALLTVLGLSVNDTIVVFDRIRENLIDVKVKTFKEVVGNSISQTIGRSINTSLSTLFILMALVIWGPVSTQIFALTLAVGLFIGTYSSIFVASPLLVLWAGENE